MGESSRNYQNGKIYCVRNSVDDDIYVGSTTQPLSKRSTKKEEKKHYKLYQKMNEVGIDNFYIELFEKYPCDSKEELFRKEGEVMRELKPILNSKIQGRTLEEWLDDNKEYLTQERKNRYERNKDQILEKKKEYWKGKRDELLLKNQKRFEENKETYYQNVKKKDNKTNTLSFTVNVVQLYV